MAQSSNAVRTPIDQRPLSTLAIVSFTLALLAFVWSMIGAFWGPGLLPAVNESSNQRWTVGAYTMIGPTILGLIALYLGSHALAWIEKNRSQRSGEGLGVFAVMIGMLAFVTGAVSCFSELIWPVL